MPEPKRLHVITWGCQMNVYDSGRMADVLAPLDLVAIPSLWYENLPTTGLNAIAAGVPLLLSDVGGLEELMLDYRCGLTFPAGEAEALAAILDPLCDDRSELDRLRAGQVLPEPFIPDRVMKALMAADASVLGAVLGTDLAAAALALAPALAEVIDLGVEYGALAGLALAIG